MLRSNPPKKFFPSRSFGKTGERRSFKPSWFEGLPWLVYVEEKTLCCVSIAQRLIKRNRYQKISLAREIRLLSLMDSRTGKRHAQDSASSYRILP